MSARTKREHGDLLSKVAEHRAAMHTVQASVEQLKDGVAEVGVDMRGRLDAISSLADATKVSIISMRSLGEQILAYIRTFPIEIRSLLRTIVQNNWHMYQVLLQVQQNTSRPPTSQHASNIRFTNVLGEYRELPYEYFCQWEVRISNHAEH